jgi:hypothetical protein
LASFKVDEQVGRTMPGDAAAAGAGNSTLPLGTTRTGLRCLVGVDADADEGAPARWRWPALAPELLVARM